MHHSHFRVIITAAVLCLLVPQLEAVAQSRTLSQYNAQRARATRYYHHSGTRAGCPKVYQTTRTAGIDSLVGGRAGIGNVTRSSAGVDTTLTRVIPKPYATPVRTGLDTQTTATLRVAGHDRYVARRHIAGRDVTLQRVKQKSFSTDHIVNEDNVSTYTRKHAGTGVHLQRIKLGRFSTDMQTATDTPASRLLGGRDTTLSHVTPKPFALPNRAALDTQTSETLRLAGRDTRSLLSRPRPAFHTDHIGGIDFSSRASRTNAAIGTTLMRSRPCP